MFKNIVGTSPIYFYGSLIVMFLAAWTRAAIYQLNRDEIREMSRASSMVADNNREFLVAVQDPLNIAWILAPVIVTVLVLMPLFFGVGHMILIWITGVIGSVLFATGFLFPTTILSRTLAVVFMAALTAVVYCVVAGADRESLSTGSRAPA